MAFETFEERLARIRSDAQGGVSLSGAGTTGRAPLPAPSGGGGPLGFIPDPIRNVAGTVAGDLFSAEEFLNSPITGNLGTNIRSGLERAPVVGGALGLGFDVGLAPATLATAAFGGPLAGGLGQLGFLGRAAAPLVAPIGGSGSFGFRLAAEAGIGFAGITGGAITKRVLDEAAEAGIPIPSAVRIGAPLLAGIATGTRAGQNLQGLRAKPIVGVGAQPVRKLTRTIRTIEVNREALDSVRNRQIGERAGEVRFEFENRLAQGEAPMQAFLKAEGHLAGELEKAPMFTRLDTHFSPQEMQSMWERIIRHPTLQRGDRTLELGETMKAFNKMMVEAQLPTMREVNLLERVFGKEFGNSVRHLRGDNTLWSNVIDALNVPRAVMASLDFSAPLRQGALLIRRKEFFTAWKPMFKSFLSEDHFDDIMHSIDNAPYAQVRRQAGVHRTHLAGESGNLLAKEETFMSAIAEGLPGVRRSERAYVGYLNKLRADVFDNTWDRLVRNGQDTPDAARQLARWVNVATGRGQMNERDMMSTANALFFSPGLLMARVRTPIEAVRMLKTPGLRFDAALDVASFVGTGLTALAIMKVGLGAEVETNSNSSDFMKVRLGTQRWDPWGGFQPIVRHISQLLTGERVNAGGERYPADEKDVIWSFLRSKLAPVPSAIADAGTGQNALGEPITDAPEDLQEMAFQRFVPLFLQDMLEATEIDGWKGALSTSPAAFGVGTANYRTAREVREEGAADLFPAEFQQGGWDGLTPSQRDEVDRVYAEVLNDVRKPGRMQIEMKARDDEAEALAIDAWRRFQSGEASTTQLRDKLREIDLTRRVAIQQMRIDFDLKDNLNEDVIDAYFTVVQEAQNAFPFDPVLQDEVIEGFLSENPSIVPQVNGFRDKTRPAPLRPYFRAKEHIADAGYWDIRNDVFTEFEGMIARLAPGVSTYNQLLQAAIAAPDPGTKAQVEAALRVVDKITRQRRELARIQDGELDAALGLVYGAKVKTPMARESEFFKLTPGALF